MKLPCIQFNLSARDYRKVEGVSKSSLDIFAECPAKYRAVQLGLIPNEQTAAMQFGTLLHSLVLDGRADFYTKPDGMTFASKDGKQWRDEHNDKPIISQSEANELHAISAAVIKHQHAAKILAGGQAEVSMFGTDKETGLTIKGRADLLTQSHIADIKTIRSATNRSCSRAIAEFNYHWQAAMYLEIARQNGIETEAFYFVFIEKGAFPLINVRRLSYEAIELGQIEYRKQLRDLKTAMDSGVWLDYSGDGLTPGEIDLPTWKYTDTTGAEKFELDDEPQTETNREIIP